MPVPTPTPEDLSKPRILLLHGGGTNARIFHLQCRVLLVHLSPYFRLVFANGPYICPPHHAIVSVYGDMPPFRRWLRWLPEHPKTTATDAISAFQRAIKDVMDGDEGTGDWVGIGGFSQGAKMAISVLWTQQAVRETLGWGVCDWNFKFGILMAGNAPPSLLDTRIVAAPGIDTADRLSLAFEQWPSPPSADFEGNDHVVRAPTLHVHGLTDPGLERHRKLMKLYAEPGTAEVVEWEGDHRVPIKREDVRRVVEGVLRTAERAGVKVEKQGTAVLL